MINLKKGSSISLEKDGRNLEKIYVGLNWGKISRYWGWIQTPVDLDASLTMFTSEGKPFDTIYYARRRSADNAVVHSGDDRRGDTSKDEKDNEVIFIDLKKISINVSSIVIYLNSYTGQQFQTIPYAKIRLLEGNANEIKHVFATFNLSASPDFHGKVSMIMAKIIRNGKGWKFVTVGEAVESKNINETIGLIRQHYL